MATRCGELPRTSRGHYCPDAVSRFWAKVEKTPEGCWLWTASVVCGYGHYAAHGRLAKSLAHRYAYELLVGPIPDGLQLDHICRVTTCVNPAHLEPVTPGENNRRSSSPSAVNAVKTRCPQGHPYDVVVLGRRVCRTCKAEWMRSARGREVARRAQAKYEARKKGRAVGAHLGGR